MFPNERAALDELASIIVRSINGERHGRKHWAGDNTTLETGVFECTYCEAWHLTARPWDDLITNAKKKQDA